MAIMKISFAYERETKGAVRYQEVTPDGVDDYAVGTLYVRKTALGKEPYPQALTVTVDAK